MLRTDGPTNQPTDTARCRVACTRLKILIPTGLRADIAIVDGSNADAVQKSPLQNSFLPIGK